MTPAEFRCAREYLGIGVDWVAAHLGVTPRQVNRWEAGTTPVPLQAQSDVEALQDYTRRVVANIIERWSLDVPLRTFRDDVGAVGVVGLPPSWHRRVVSEVHESLSAGIEYALTPSTDDLQLLLLFLG